MSEKLFLQALAGRVTPRPPVWLMRQAGRYLPEYREVRAGAGGFLELCYNTDLAVEVTLQPIRRYGFDAAIVFSDILVVPDALGAKVWFVEGEGPRVEPVDTLSAIEALSLNRLHDHLQPVYAALEGLRAGLPHATALIGFAGAPWTLAAYMIEGGGSKEFAKARLFAREEPRSFAKLIDLLTQAVVEFFDRQVAAGAEALQLFDSWAGVLPPAERNEWCVKPARTIVSELRRARPSTPLLCFPRGVGAAYASYAGVVRPAGLSLDTTVDPVWAASSLPAEVCLQGNLDPLAVVAGGQAMRDEARSVLDAWRDRPFVFNLGHGVVPQTPPDHVAELVELLKSASR